MVIKEQELDLKIWKGADKWAKKAIKYNWKVRKQSDFYDNHELASSIHGFICKELNIGFFHPKKMKKKKKESKMYYKCFGCGKRMKEIEDPIAKKKTGHNFTCKCMGKDKVMSIG